jgi:hypothetical protein
MAKPADPMPPGARSLNPVFHEWWRRIVDPNLALGEFNRALADGRLMAWVSGEGILPVSYWRTHRVVLDRKEPECVIVHKGRLEVLASFYIAPMALPQPMAQPQPAPETKKEKSKQQKLILKLAAEEFPGGWEDVSTKDIIDRVGRRLKDQKLPVPGRDTFERALDRRLD